MVGEQNRGREQASPKSRMARIQRTMLPDSLAESACLNAEGVNSLMDSQTGNAEWSPDKLSQGVKPPGLAGMAGCDWLVSAAVLF